jgi:hypothetical protein
MSPDPTVAESERKDSRIDDAATRLNRINLIWEITQASLAVMLLFGCIITSMFEFHEPSETLRNALFVVIGFYFGRTNHHRPTVGQPS